MKKYIAFLVVAMIFIACTLNVTAESNLTSGFFEGKVRISEDVLINVNIKGNSKKNSVVFISGYGDGINTFNEQGNKVSNWSTVQTEISKYAKTISYDRAGIGESSPGTNRPSLEDMDIQKYINGGTISYDSSIFKKGEGKTAVDKAKDLHALLKKSKVKGPYILVAHSIGIYEAIEFAELYKSDVKAIVNVDGSPVTLLEDFTSWAKVNNPEIAELFLNQFGPNDGTLSEIVQSELQVTAAKQKNVLQNIPMIVLHPSDLGMGESYQRFTNELILNWSQWSNRSTLKYVDNSSHYIQLDNPQEIINAVKSLL